MQTVGKNPEKKNYNQVPSGPLQEATFLLSVQIFGEHFLLDIW
jgi:hypothetical protein